MVSAILIKEILSGSSAIMQDIDGRFFVLTNEDPESQQSRSPYCLSSPLFFHELDLRPRYFSKCSKLERQELIHALESFAPESTNQPKKPSHTPMRWEAPLKQTFISDFQKIKNQIASGHLQKAVVMTSETTHSEPSKGNQLLYLLNLLKNCPPHLFIYGYWTPTNGVLGATPELLFYRKDDSLYTMALAGTSPKVKMSPTLETCDQFLLNDPKERFEHQLVVEDLAEKLSSFFAPLDPSIHIDGPHLLELPHLFHLQTHIRLKINPSHFLKFNDLELLIHLHPSSALGLRSRMLSWNWLKSLDGHKNIGNFGAPIGFSFPNGYLSLVQIRNIEWSHGTSRIRAGCGIVQQSELEREWVELKAKRESVKALLGI